MKKMDWNKYLYEIINKRIEADHEAPIFSISNTEGKMHDLNNYAILEYIDHYTNELKNMRESLCDLSQYR